MKRIMMPFAALVLIVMGVFAFSSAASATDNHDTKKCYDTVVDVPEHEIEVEDSPAQEAIPGNWWNWSPNKDQGPFDGPPAFPTDERGTWQGPHTEGGPSQDLTGTFQQGQGNAPWFHREPGTPAVDATFHMETVPATYKQVEVPCDEEPPVDVCPDIPENQPEGTDCNPVIPPIDEPPVTDTPVDNPPVDNPPADEKTPETITQVDKQLPDTGGAPIGILILGGLAVVMGLGIIGRSRLSYNK